MKRKFFDVLAGAVLGAALSLGWSLPTLAQGDPLPSWNDTPTKRAVVEFVGRVTKAGPDFVAPAERIATFDNDGTLWVEQPMYVQMDFALDRVKALAPRFKRSYTELVYQPMLELLSYLRANGFKTFIVSGGGVEFMRPWTEKVYGIPSEQVIGSSIKTKFQMRDGSPHAIPVTRHQ